MAAAPRKHGDRKKEHGKGPVDDIGGVQKIKSSLRQTRRLLAKDNLAPDIRVSTERRLKSLENDLEVAERKRKEKELATRYHKVKFFEKRKILRRIRQCKKDLSEGDARSSKVSATDLENRLFELRSQLNYILNYPKLEKYIALFPGKDGEDDSTSTSAAPEDTTSSRRKEILNGIQERMRQGLLNSEPELDGGSIARVQLDSTDLVTKRGHKVGERSRRDTRKRGDARGSRPLDSHSTGHVDNRIEEDDFFENVGD